MNQFKQKQYNYLKNKQQGFVLIMALVLLAVLTLIGVASMNSANMELRATANAQQHQVAFNAAQSLVECAASEICSKVNYQDTGTGTQLVSITVDNAAAVQGNVTHAGCSVGVGSSLEEGKGFSYNFYHIEGSASNKTAGGAKGSATSFQNQGVRYPAAAC